MTTLRARLAAIAAAGLLTLTAVGVVSAASSPAPSAEPGQPHRCEALRQAVRNNATVGNLRELGICEIDLRQATLDRLLARVSNSKVMTADHKSTLTGQLTAAQSGLAGLEGTIKADTTVDQLKADIKKIATDYRIYALVGPKVRLVNATDGANLAVTRFGTVNTKLQARIDAAKTAGKDVTAAQASLDAMNQQVAAAQAAVASIDEGRLIALTPADWNSGTAKPILAAVRSSLTTARGDFKAARADAKACVAALKALGA